MSRVPTEGASFPRSQLFPFVLAGAICLSPTALLWPSVYPDQLGYVLTNLADRSFPPRLALWHLAGFALVASLYGARWLRWQPPGPGRLLAAVRWTNARLLVLLAFPLLGALRAPGIEKEAPFFTVSLAVLAATLVGTSAYHVAASFSARRHQPAEGRTAHWARRTALVSVLAGIATYTVLLSSFSIANLHDLRVPSFDLAIYDNLVWNTSHGNFLASNLVRGGTHMSAHFDPILVFLTPLYRLAPRAETLLILQSFWLASGALPLFLLSARILSNAWFAAVIAGAFLLHPALHGINMYEFHSLALVSPLLLWAVYCAESGRFRAYWIVLALILLTREDMSLLSCGIGLYLVDGLRRNRMGLATIVCALTYLIVVKTFVMPEPELLMSGQGDSYSYRTHFEQMIPREGGGVKDFLLTLLTNPVFALRVATEEQKLLFGALLLVPAGLLPLFTGTRLLLLAYGVVFCLLSSRPGPHSIYHQYTSVILPLIMALLPLGLWRVSQSRYLEGARLEVVRARLALVVCVAVASVLVSWKFGVFFENSAFRVGGWMPPVHFEPAAKRLESQRRYDFLTTLLEQIPESASVSATNFLVPHVSNRETVHIYPRGTNADYLLIQLRVLRGRALRSFEALRASGRFETLAEGEGFVLLRRVDLVSPVGERHKHKASARARRPSSALGRTASHRDVAQAVPPVQ